jgi:Ca2+-binding RTX toxin-like protein
VATYTSSFSSWSGLENLLIATQSYMTSTDASLKAAAASLTTQLFSITPSLNSSTSATGYAAGMTANYYGSNFGTSNAVVTSANITDSVNTLTLRGSISIGGLSYSGNITSMDFTGQGYSEHTIVQITLGASTYVITSSSTTASTALGNVTTSFTGAITNYSATSAYYNYSTLALSDAVGHTISVSGLNTSFWDNPQTINSTRSMVDMVRSALSGNDVANGSSGANDLRGFAGNDVLNGLAGNDILNGGLGADNMIGGTGNDTYVVDNALDVTTETSTLPTEIDTVQSSLTRTLGANLENLMLIGSSAINGTGNGLNNTMTGNAVANILNGGVGADTLKGALGNDTSVVYNALDVTTETSALLTEIDRVQSSVTRALGANLENLTLTGTSAINGTGNVLNNTITGNAAANKLDGGAGNDILNGSAGADTMKGGFGNDTYIRDNAGDVITELAAQGTDSVMSSLAYTLGANLENLTLTGVAVINGTGNALNNVLTGNAAANILNGGSGNDTLNGGSGNDTFNGGAGADTMIGGLGNDTFYVDNALDVVNEALNSGADMVISSINYSLAGLTNVENLTLTGAALVNATGNVRSNSITGNVADNVLDGGTGVDTLIGGLGNDTYIVDNALDIVTEELNSGIDSVQSGVTYTLGNDVEDLLLTGVGNISGTGNALANSLTGNSGINILDGGAGTDIMTGGLGNDIFAFSASLDGTVDTIADFVAGDQIQLGASGLTGALSFVGLLGTNGNGTGSLGATEFVAVAGAVANAANTQILYDTSTGILSFDTDGTGVNAAVAFAQLTGMPALTTTDFLLT